MGDSGPSTTRFDAGEASAAGAKPQRTRPGNSSDQSRSEGELVAAIERYERQLRLFDSIASTTPDFVYVFDCQGRFLYANRHLLEVWGMKIQQVIGKTCLELGYEKWHHDMHMREIAQVIATKAPIKGEVPFKAPLTGIFGVYEYIFTPVIGPDGEVEAVAGTTRDVTERKQAEEALRESERNARQRLAEIEALYESAPIGLCVFDRNLRWVRLNKRIAEINGVPVEAHLGKTPREIVPDVGEQAEAALQRILDTGEPQMDFEMSGTTAAQPGVVRYWKERWVPLKDSEGRIIGISVAAEEITEKKRAEEARRASEQRERARAAELETVMEAVPVAMYISRDLECAEVVGNRMAYEILGVPLGGNISINAAGAVPFRAEKDGRPIPLSELPPLKAVATGQSIRNYEHDLIVRDGTRRTLLGHAAPLLGEDGRPRGSVGAFLDITERKRDEERLRQSQKLESIGTLAGGMAHDFNNLLTGILGNASMALEEVGPGQAEHINEVVRSAERAAQLTRQLLAYSGKGQFIVRDLDVSETVQEISGLVEFSLPKNVQISVTVQRRLPLVRMDPSQLQQILMNVVINAGEAIGEENPGRITVATSMADIERPLTDAVGHELAPGRYVCIEVTDSGCGIDGEQKSRIFDPFFTTKFTGRGLGLAAVAGILRSQRGGITVTSAPGQGSTFRVFLPSAEKHLAEAGARRADEYAGTALVVDDEASVRDFIDAALRRKGYRVLTASDGREALSVCEREQGAIDVIVLDVVMPVMGANELLPRLRERRPDAAILLTSGYSESEARRLCAAYPGASFIQKPYTSQTIAAAVEAQTKRRGGAANNL